MQYINNMRGIAIILVVLIHAISTLPSNDSLILLVMGKLLDNCSLLFVLLAGYLFSYQMDNYSYFKFLSTKVKSLLIPYLVLSVPAISLYLTGFKTTHYWIDMAWFSSLSNISKVIYFIFTGAHLGPLWFIPMIFSMYLLSPLVVYFANKNILWVLFIILVGAGFVVGRPEFNENILKSIAYFSPAFVLGTLIEKNKHILKFNKNFNYFLIAVSTLIYSILSAYIDISSSFDLIIKLFFCFILMNLSSIKLNKKNKVLSMFAKLSFFIFFIHGYFAGVIRTLNIKYVLDLGIFNVAYVAFIAIAILTLSIATFVLIKLTLQEKSKIWIGV